MANASRLLFTVAIALVALPGAACEDLPPTGDGLPAAPAAGIWIPVEPGGDTICSRGTPYRFFVRGGDPAKLMVYFEGGGACWNASTCSISETLSLFRDDVSTFEDFQAALNGGLGGVLDGTAGLAFSDYTIVYVPYCTGDIHWGDALAEYSDTLSIEHRGFINTNAALDWMYARFANPETVFVSGCSAGAYGAALHSAYIANQYPDAKIAVLADSGAGIITETFLNDSLPNWSAEKSLPSFISGLQKPITELALADVYIEVGKYFPEIRLAQTATQFDADQIFYFSAMGGEPVDWSPQFRSSLDAIAAATSNFRFYVPPGSVHCVTPYPYFHERTVGGVSLADWTLQLVEGETIPDSVACTGSECCSDPECDACKAGKDASYCRFCLTWPPEWSECAVPAVPN